MTAFDSLMVSMFTSSVGLTEEDSRDIENEIPVHTYTSNPYLRNNEVHEIEKYETYTQFVTDRKLGKTTYIKDFNLGRFGSLGSHIHYETDKPILLGEFMAFRGRTMNVWDNMSRKPIQSEFE